jgi:hypothetical protein
MTTNDDRELEGGERPAAPLSRAHAAAVLRLGVSVEQDGATGARADGLEDRERGSIAPNAPFAGDTRRAAAAGGITVAMLVAAGIGIPDSGQVAPIGRPAGGSVKGSPGSTAVRSAIDAGDDRRQEQDPMKSPGVRAAVVAGVVMIASSAGAQQMPAVQWRVEDGGNGHWYKVLQTGRQVCWTEAEQLARSLGGYLCSETSAAEHDFVSINLISQPTAWSGRWGPWIGARQTDAGWSWTTGEPWSFSAWYPGEPNGGGTERFVSYIAIGEGGGCGTTTTWNDWVDCGFGEPTGCDVGVWNLVIEWSADCNADGIVDYGQILAGAFDDANNNGVPDCCDRGEYCEPDPCAPIPTLLQDDFYGTNLNQGVWSTYLPFVCSAASQSNGAVEFRARGHLRSKRDIPVVAGGIEIRTRFTYVSGDEFFDTVVMTDASTSGGAIANGLLLTFVRYPGQDPFVIHASQNFQLGPVIKSGAVTIVPGDMFEATMRITPTHVAAELHNLTKPTEIFRVERTWSGAPFGNKLVCYNREFCDDRTDLHEIVVSRIAANTSDCDSDGVTDFCEIRAGAADSNANGIPDLCELPSCIDADLNPNGVVDGADLGAMLAFWGPVSPAFPRADINGDGNVNGADLGILLSLWGPCGG